MSKSEIQSWLSSASISDENGGFDQSLWRRDRVLDEWPAALQFAQSQLLTSKTRTRIRFLEEELLSLAQHGGELSLIISAEMMLTAK